MLFAIADSVSGLFVGAKTTWLLRERERSFATRISVANYTYLLPI
ncbi:hypothetical protein LINPERPRIM_LOCUS29480 [Linum perenne]